MAEPQTDLDYVELTPEQLAARKRRNLLLAFSVGAFMLLVFFITIAQLKNGAAP